MRGQLTLMLAIGMMAGVGYTLKGLPNGALLAVVAGLFEIVPMLGPVLAFAPAVLVALAIDAAKALVVVGYALGNPADREQRARAAGHAPNRGPCSWAS